MNKTISINLAGVVFQIDENAYQRLAKYLDSLSSQFVDSEERQEIISDIEARIAELFSSRKNGKAAVVTLTDVEQVIAVLGEPEEFEEESDQTNAQSSTGRPKRRLFRDPDDMVLGGVSSGLSAYVGIDDPIWIRLFFVLFTLLGIGAPILIYVILWVIVPKAVTSVDKLQMRGEPVTISTIEKTVREEYEQVKNSFSDLGKKNGDKEGNRFLRSFFETIRTFFQLFFQVFSKLIGIVLILCGTSSLIALTIITLICFSFILPSANELGTFFFGSNALFALSGISLLLLVGVPTLAFIYLGIRILAGIQARKRSISWGLAALWLIGFVTTCVTTSRLIYDFNTKSRISETIELAPIQSDTLTIRANQTQILHRKNSSSWLKRDIEGLAFKNDSVLINRIQFDIVKSDDNKMRLKKTAVARGKNDQIARLKAEKISYTHIQTDSLLTLSDHITFLKSDGWRSQKLNLRLELPVGKTIFLDQSTRPIIYDIKNVHNTYDRHMTGRTWEMKEEGLTCLDCPEKVFRKKSNSTRTNVGYSFENFDRISLDGAFNVKLKQDRDFKIEIRADENNLRDLNVSQTGDRIEFERDFGLKKWKRNIDVIIHLPEIESLESHGASKITMDKFDQESIKLELHDATEANLKLEVKELDARLIGASEVKLSGSCEYADVVLSGAANCSADNFKIELLNIDMTGATDFRVAVSESIEGSIQGASSFRYDGDPTLNLEKSGLASVNQYD